MKVLIVNCAYKYTGGESSVVDAEMKLLISVGHSVKLLKFSNTANRVFKLLQLPFNLSAYAKTIKEIRDFKPDVVHVHNLHFGASASVLYAIKSRKMPVVITLHNFRLLCPSATLFYNGKPFLDSLEQSFTWSAARKGVYKNSRMLTFWLSISMKIHQKLNTWALADRYIVLSENARELFKNPKLKLSDQQLVVKPNFTYPAVSRLTSCCDHFLFVGRLSNEKGIMFLLNTFSQLSYTLRIAGDGPLKDQVIKFAERFSNIQYVGTLNKEEVSNEMQNCVALVFPSIWYEGMPLTIIEAFACGTPVIASKLGAMKTMVKHDYNGLHFEAENKSDLEHQVKKFFSLNAEEKTKYRINALNTYKEYYTPEKNVDQLLTIYNSIITENKHPKPASV